MPQSPLLLDRAANSEGVASRQYRLLRLAIATLEALLAALTFVSSEEIYKLVVSVGYSLLAMFYATVLVVAVMSNRRLAKLLSLPPFQTLIPRNGGWLHLGRRILPEIALIRT
jgi:hypothetical protein